MKFCFEIFILLTSLFFANGQANKKCGYGRARPECDECGKVFVKSGRIIGGKSVLTNEWSSVVFIQFNYKFYFDLFTVLRIQRNCTGTLLNKKTVLTSASCYSKKLNFLYNDQPQSVVIEPNNFYPTFESMYKVFVGMTDIRKLSSAVQMDIESFKIHPDYDENNYLNDIGVIRLPFKVKYSKSIQPACLPNPKTKNYPTQQNIQLWAVGWGITDLSYKFPNKLQKVLLNRYSFSKCKNVLSSVIKNSTTQMCVGFLNGGKDTCYGDGGAPLFKTELVNGVKKFIISGITSYGEGCARKGLASIYTKVSSFLDWIEQESLYDEYIPSTTMRPGGKTICTENFNDGYCDVCGRTFQQPNIKIVGGVLSQPYSWPSAVYLKISSQSGTFVCGGTLINRDTVITAAHCFIKVNDQPSAISVYLGTNDMSLVDSSSFNGVKRSVQKLILHQNYDLEKFSNDIAILKLSEPVTFSDKIQPACLPPNENYPDKLDDPVYAVGWGKTDFTDLTSSPYQRNVKLTMYESTKCAFMKEYDPTTQICAGEIEGGKDTCQGDSGGPLYLIDSYEQEVIQVLTGITSYGYGCGEIGQPGAFTRVRYYLSWIRENML